jgi:colicin import membrane protein
VYQEIQVTYINNNEWKLPLNLAIGLHALLLVTVIYAPGLFTRPPIIPEFATVNLVNIVDSGPKEEGGPKSEAAPKKVEAAKLEPKPEIKVKPVEVKQPDPPPEPVVKPHAEPIPVPPPVNAVSLDPLKRKLREEAKDAIINEQIRKIELKQRQKQELEQKKELENIRKQRVIEAARAQRIAEEEARIAADELKQLIHTSTSIKSPVRNTTGSMEGDGSGSGEGHRSGSNNSSALESQYQAALFNRLQRFWSLPEYKKWEPSLTAIVVITISQDGTITNQFFERRSGDKIFDQFVEKTLRDAAPLPQIPAALRKQQYEIGLRFSPTGIR